MENKSILPLSDTSVAPSSMVSASAPSIYSVQALSLLAEVSRFCSCSSHLWGGCCIDIAEQRKTWGVPGQLNGRLNLYTRAHTFYPEIWPAFPFCQKYHLEVSRDILFTFKVLASLLDMVYRSDEKEKAVPLISRLLYYVFPYLRNHRWLFSQYVIFTKSEFFGPHLLFFSVCHLLCFHSSKVRSWNLKSVVWALWELFLYISRYFSHLGFWALLKAPLSLYVR